MSGIHRHVDSLMRAAVRMKESGLYPHDRVQMDPVKLWISNMFWGPIWMRVETRRSWVFYYRDRDGLFWWTISCCKFQLEALVGVLNDLDLQGKELVDFKEITEDNREQVHRVLDRLSAKRARLQGRVAERLKAAVC